MNLFTPGTIPLSYFYFGYKKAKNYVLREASFCDYIDLEDFERNLDENLLDIQSTFKLYEDSESGGSGYYKMGLAVLYLFPKSFGQDEEARMRPKTLFRFRDQVAWATVILALSEWFDTNPRMKEVLSLEEQDKRRLLDWMVPWSYNDRLKRVHKYIPEKDQYEKSYIHFNGSSLYESFQWGLRQLNTNVRMAEEKILEHHPVVYKGITDIEEFYPTLKKAKIEEMFKGRFQDLVSEKVLEIDGDVVTSAEPWLKLISDLLNYDLVYPDAEIAEKNIKLVGILKEYYIKISRETEVENFKIRDMVLFLKDTLPLDLIASGFLSNCTLTYFLDKKLEKYMQEVNGKENNTSLSIYRYTDDITIISSDKKLVEAVIKKIRINLDKLRVKLSDEKTRPLETDTAKKLLYNKIEKNNDVDNIVGIKELIDKNPKQLKIFQQAYGIETAPFEIKKKNLSLGPQALLEDLSKASDVQVQSMDSVELDGFLEEMFYLMNVKLDSNEVNDETKVTFASWRIRKSFKEKLDRAMDPNLTELDKSFGHAIKKYPYKLSLHEVYLLCLLDGVIAGRKKVSYIQYLRDYLFNISENFDQVSMLLYSPFIRTKILFVFSDQWFRVPHGKREELRSLLSDAVQQWYKEDTILWHEKYALYWCYTTCGITVNPDLNMQLDLKTNSIKKIPLKKNVKRTPTLQSSLDILKESYILHTDFYYQVMSTNQKPSNLSIENVLPETLYMLSHLFKKSLYFNPEKRKMQFTEFESKWYKSIWGLYRKLFENKATAIQKKLLFQTWIRWANIKPEMLNNVALEILGTQNFNLEETSKMKNNSIEILSLLNRLIVLYFQRPSEMQFFFNWLNDKKDFGDEEDTISYKGYVRRRFYYYSLIRMRLSLDPDTSPKLPLDLAKVIENNKPVELDEIVIPISDWLFYCEYTYQKHGNKNRYLEPLAELEMVRLLSYLFFEKDEIALKNEIYLMTHGLTVEKWLKFRENKKGQNRDLVKEVIDEKEGKYKNLYKYPALENGSGFTENFSVDLYIYSITLFSMLAKRTINSINMQRFYLFKWKDLQTYFYTAYFPSTTISSLLVNTLNIHRNFYEKYYGLLDQSRLPYRKLGNTPIDSRESYKKNIEDYFNKNEENVITLNDNSMIELIVIDTDLMVEGDD